MARISLARVTSVWPGKTHDAERMEHIKGVTRESVWGQAVGRYGV